MYELDIEKLPPPKYKIDRLLKKEPYRRELETNWLLHDLYAAYYAARRHKRNTNNQLRFELNLEDNLHSLYEDIRTRTYQLSPGIAFVVTEPKIREIFAATFRDRVVHHLVYDYIADYWDRHFIYDSYSCRPGKGTHFGIQRIAKFILKETDNYRRPAWILKCDIAGYFMNMNQQIIWDLVHEGLYDPKFIQPQAIKDLLVYLLPIIIFADPTQKVNIRGNWDVWTQLPTNKSLFFTPPGKGFPIGNLTSQLFSNIYLNELDQFVLRDLHVGHYGRYVDDFVLVHQDKEYLLYCRNEIDNFLQDKLKLQLHPKKVYLQPASHGVDFIGARIRRDGIHPGKRIMRNFTQFLHATADLDQDEKWDAQLASFMGHTHSYKQLL